MEKPAEVRLRSEVRQWKKLKLGKFVENGKYFLFFKALMVKMARYWDGPLGVGNALPFSKLHNYGDKLHYETPMAGDRTSYQRARMHRAEEGEKSLLVTRTIHVSGKNLFNVQQLPAEAHA